MPPVKEMSSGVQLYPTPLWTLPENNELYYPIYGLLPLFPDKTTDDTKTKSPNHTSGVHTETTL